MSNPPSLTVSLKRAFTIPLMGTVGAGPNVGLTIIAGPLTFPFRVTGAEIVFRNDTANLLQIYLMLSNNTATSTGVPPADTNLLATFGPTTYLLGESLIKRVSLDYIAESDQKYIKVHGLNGCAYPQTINVTITVEDA